MLSHGTCREPKVRRLNDAEFRAFVAALCMAGASPVRGQLLVTLNEPVTAADVADEARISEDDAQRALDKMQRLGALELDESTGALRFTNWHRYNPSPKPSDTPDAWRERKRRERARKRTERPQGQARPKPVSARDGGGLPTPPTGSRGRDRDHYRKSLDDLARSLYPAAFNGHGNTRTMKAARDAVDSAIRSGVPDESGVRKFIAAGSYDFPGAKP
jgi:hypothetical protein